MVHINPIPNPVNHFEAIFGTGNADTSRKEEDSVAVALDRAFDVQRAIGILAAVQGKNRHESKIMDDIIDTLSDIAEEIRSEIVKGASSDNDTSPKTDPEYPEYLVTEEDYRDAPEGTIIAAGDGIPLEWREEGWMYGDEEFPIRAITGDPRRVLRWGWEA